MKDVKPYEFERYVGDLYRALGAEVKHDVMLAGIQIDLLLKEKTASGSSLARLVECKAYSSRVGSPPVRSFAMTSHLLRTRGVVDAATLVSANGFTAQARLMADEFGVELLEASDLEARIVERGISSVDSSKDVTSSADGLPPEVPVAHSRPIKAFVALPFTPRYDDVYLLGIRAAAEALEVSVERADDNLESNEIVEYIKARIASSDFVIADTSEPNPNVFYELGFSDGLGKPALLIAASSTELPFDLRGRNHLLYENINGLRDGLIDRLPHFRDLNR